MTTLRCVLTSAPYLGIELVQMDVKNSFLNGVLEEDVYMKQHECYVHPKFSHDVCRLRKALHGMKQAPKLWSRKAILHLQNIGFEIIKAVQSLYIQKVSVELVVIVVYVDDIIITRDSK